MLLALPLALPAQAQTTAPPFFPLEITNIGPVGVNGMQANNRIFRAYPGIEYNIRAAVVGGVYPYTYSLQNAPSGMTIAANTGTISWPNPQADASNVTIVVRDAAGVSRTASWSIDVTEVGFNFVDAVNGRNAANNGCSSSCGNGTITNPWRTLGDLALNDDVSDITYFRNGTYSANDAPSIRVSGTYGGRIVFSDRAESSYPGSVIWIAYPGQSPRIDFGYGTSPANWTIRFNGANVYVDGFEAVNAQYIGFQFESSSAYRGPTFRRLRMHNLGPGGDGTNSAFIMTVSSYPSVAYGMVIQDSQFYDVNITDPDAAVTLKVYSTIKTLIEDTVQYNAITATELKADVRQFTVRNNLFYNLTGTAIGGNMHGCVSCSGGADLQTVTGEILFNNVRGANPALDLNQDGQALRINVYRNTFRGRTQIRNVDSADGPFYLANNVIVNSDPGTPTGSHVLQFSVTAPSQVVLSNNLSGNTTDNIIDANGNLTAGYAQWVGSRGYQLGSGSGTTTLSAPSNLRIVGGQE